MYALLLGYYFSGFYNYRFHGNVLMEAVTPGFYAFDLVNNVHAVNYFAKYGITPTLYAFAGEIQEVVIFDVDKKLGGSGMGILGAGHGDGARIILQAIVGFVFDWVFSAFLLHIFIETAALDHEAINYPVEDGSVIVTIVNIAHEVLYGDRGFFFVQFKFDVAHAGVKNN